MELKACSKSSISLFPGWHTIISMWIVFTAEVASRRVELVAFLLDQFQTSINTEVRAPDPLPLAAHL